MFFKQRDNSFFPPASYVAGLLLTQVPQITAESIIFSLIVYFIVGLQPAGEGLR